MYYFLINHVNAPLVCLLYNQVWELDWGMKENTHTIREEFKICLDEGGGRCADFMSRLFCFNIFFLF